MHYPVVKDKKASLDTGIEFGFFQDSFYHRNSQVDSTSVSMPNSLITSEPKVLHPKDFDPPLKRKKPTVPGYWTLEEIGTEIGMTSRKVQYDVLGRPESGLKPSLKAYKVAKVFLVPDKDALQYIQRYRNRKKS